MAVQFSEEHEGEVTVLLLEGRLDAASSPSAQQRVASLIDGGVTKLVLDLEKVDYMSSAGMRLILEASKKLKSKGGKIVLSSLKDEVMEVIQMAGFDQILEITATKGEALAAF